MSFRILITSRSFGREDPGPLRMLEQAGCELIWSPFHRPLTDEELAGLVGNVDGIIAGLDWVGPHTLTKGAPRLRVVSRTGVGYDRIDIDTATRLGVAVTITLGANSEAVADLTIGLLIALARQIPEADRSLRAGEWNQYTGRELWRKRLGLVGLGHVGKGVARRAAAGFAMEVVAYDTVWDDAFSRKWGVRRAQSLDEIFETCDFVSLHVPETPATRHLVNRDRLRRMKPTAYLVNTARGGLVDEEALVEALREGWIAGAAIDVFEKEPPVGSALLELPNVVVTPHIGAHTVEAVRKMSQMAAENLLAVLVERRLPNGIVNPEALQSRR